MKFNLLIDADSLPIRLRNIILKMSKKRKVNTIFIADRPLKDVISLNKEYSNINMIVVETNSDSADDKLVEISKEGDIAITRDVILADRLVSKNIIVLDDRGGMFTKENMATRLSLRNVMTELRNMGLQSDKVKPLNEKDIQAFANQLDSNITKLLKQK